MEYLSSVWGMKIYQSPHIPKKEIPITPKTDDMRAMFETLEQFGAATPQVKLVDQILIMDGNIFAPPRLMGVIANVC